MVPCAYCEHPLICDGCQTPYTPASQEHYEALSRPEVPVAGNDCGAVLVCHWCKTPYDGGAENPDDPAAEGGRR